jgi:hypothetical protein
VPDYLPNVQNARIDPRKLRDYALNAKHADGQFKAAFFAQMGYATADWQRLEQDIREQHLTQPVEPGHPSAFGTKYVITAPLTGPNGAVRQVTTVWLIRPSRDYAELVTIEPAARRKVN